MPAKQTDRRYDVAVIMGSKSDWDTMRHAAEVLDDLGIAHDVRIVSAHRTPQRLYEFATGAREAGVKVIIAGAGGAAHLPGMTAALTPLPVFGVPVKSKTLSGQDSLYSIVQMPAGVPVGTLAIGRAGATNAALLAASVLALTDKALAKRLDACRAAAAGAGPGARSTPSPPRWRPEPVGRSGDPPRRQAGSGLTRTPPVPHPRQAPGLPCDLFPPAR